MNTNLSMNDVPEILASIRESLSEANTAFDRGGDADWRIQSAFAQMRIFLEAAGFLEALKDVQRIEADAKQMPELTGPRLSIRMKWEKSSSYGEQPFINI